MVRSRQPGLGASSVLRASVSCCNPILRLLRDDVAVRGELPQFAGDQQLTQCAEPVTASQMDWVSEATGVGFGRHLLVRPCYVAPAPMSSRQAPCSWADYRLCIANMTSEAKNVKQPKTMMPTESFTRLSKTAPTVLSLNNRRDFLTR